MNFIEMYLALLAALFTFNAFRRAGKRRAARREAAEAEAVFKAWIARNGVKPERRENVQ